LQSLEADGQPTPGFGTAGTVDIAPAGPDAPYVVALAGVRDGRVLAVVLDRGQGVIRLGADGVVEPGYGATGEFLNLELIVAIHPLSGDRALIVSWGPKGSRVRRLTADGTVDPGYGPVDIPAVPLWLYGSDATVAFPDGSLVVAGAALSETGEWTNELAIARVDPQGRLDQAFGTRGVFRAQLGGTQEALITSIDVDSLGRILLAGLAYTSEKTYPFTARLLQTGRPDPTYGRNGARVLPTVSMVPMWVDVDARDRALLVGYGGDAGGAAAGVTRIQGGFSPLGLLGCSAACGDGLLPASAEAQRPLVHLPQRLPRIQLPLPS
jgi:uncharacterized delta-60 repeat protein